jgi:3-oxoacyl-[acyl-carrier-protein] synthase II
MGNNRLSDKIILGEGSARAIQIARVGAESEPDMVGYISALGTLTLVNTFRKSGAVRWIFGKKAEKPAITLTKSMRSHMQEAHGVFQLVTTTLKLFSRFLPPRNDFTKRNPGFDVGDILSLSRKASCECDPSNSFGFGGLCAALIFGKCF